VAEFCDHSNGRACGSCILQGNFWLAEQLLGFQEGCDAGFLLAFYAVPQSSRDSRQMHSDCKSRDKMRPKNRPRRPRAGFEVHQGGGWSALHPSRFTPGKRPGTHCTGGWAGPRGGPDRRGKSRPHRHSIHGPSNL
jgi:hypothetical protein